MGSYMRQEMAADNSGYLKFLMSAKMNFYRFKNWGKERLETESKSLWSKLKEARSLTIKYNGKTVTEQPTD